MTIISLIRIVIAVQVATLLLFAGVAYVSVANQQYNCSQTELVKGRIRANAEHNYAELARNGKLLNIKITPQLRKTSHDELLQTEKDFAANKCHGIFGH